MLHDSTSIESNMSDDTEKPVPPLTARKEEDGTLYTRFADVEAEIRAVWRRPPPDLIRLKEKVKNETLVFLIHRAGLKDDYIRGQLQAELDERTIRISESTAKFRGLDDVFKEEIALEVQTKVFNLVWSEEDCSQAQFLEVTFAEKVRALTKNVIERSKKSVMAEREQLDVATEKNVGKGRYGLVELREDVPDLRRDQEEMLILLEDDSRQDELLEKIRDFVKDSRHFLALYLFHAQDKSLREIAAVLKTTVRTARAWKDTAMHQIRVGLGIETEEKREALRKLRNARRAVRRKESTRPARSAQAR